jgi:hypothetical protein
VAVLNPILNPIVFTYLSMWPKRQKRALAAVRILLLGSRLDFIL